MTPLQKYVSEHGVEAVAKLGIQSYRHPTLPLVGFKYTQWDSEKTNEVVRWARGTVLEDKTWKLVAQPFVRFFNWGEDPAEMAKFDWSNCECTEKADGSLIIAYNYHGEWQVNTSGSFGFGKVQQIGNQNWRELFWSTFYACGGNKAALLGDRTYLFELCTPINKVVRMYAKPTVYLLSTFIDDKEVHCGAHADDISIGIPELHEFSSADHVQVFLRERAQSDPTFEGIVARDSSGTRFKIKNSSYLALHRLKDNNNIARTDRMIEIALAGEQDEVLTYFPELTDEFNKVKERLDAELNQLTTAWRTHMHLETQKDFAMAVKALPYSSIMFQARKTGQPIDAIWRASGDAIIKRWKGK